jgi:hypothetical protein
MIGNLRKYIGFYEISNMNRDHNNGKLNIASLIAIVGFPLLAAAVTTFIIFLHQAMAFTGTFLTGEWQILFVVILFLEAFFVSIVAALFSMVVGVGAAMGLGKNFSFLEGLIVALGTTAIYGFGFWWLMAFLTRIIGLGSDPLPTALVVYLLILPISQVNVFFVSTIWAFIVTYFVGFK